jgi:hypothetical protein
MENAPVDRLGTSVGRCARGGGNTGDLPVLRGGVEGVVDAEDVRVGVDVDDAATLEVGEYARAGDLQRIGHVSGRKSGERPELEVTARGRGVHAV